MTKYLISFPGRAMSHIPDEDWATVGEESHQVIRAMKTAGVYVFGGGIDEEVDSVRVAGDGSTSSETYPQTKEFNGGFTVIEAPTREEALEWARRVAVACRCDQELRQFMDDPES